MPLQFVKPGAITPNTTEYFAVCGLGGILSCGLTHAAVTPIDVVKCNKQSNPTVFTKGMFGNGGIIFSKRGILGNIRGWSPTFVGYSFQGLGKFGLNDIFKYQYSKLLGKDFKHDHPKLFYAMASGSAEFFADILLCPWETVKLKVQTVDIPDWLDGKSKGYARGIHDGVPRLMREEGLGGFYNILKMLWARQIPYTIVKFVAFEDFILRLYDLEERHWGIDRNDLSKNAQLGMTFSAGYAAGVFCGIVSHPADTMASLKTKYPDNSIGDLFKSNGGFMGLWKGLGARVFMIGTLTGLQWFIYDTTKVAFGLPSGGVKQKKK